jgi:hypothetical protein
MTKNITRLFLGMAAIAIVLMLADTGNAQRREARGRKMNKAQVQAIVRRVEDRVDNFVKNLDRSLDRSRINNKNREDWLNGRARDLERATDELSREFGRRDAWIENLDEVRNCLNIASDIDRNMRNRRFGAASKTNWNRVRFELKTLADVYNMPKVGANVYR